MEEEEDHLALPEPQDLEEVDNFSITSSTLVSLSVSLSFCGQVFLSLRFPIGVIIGAEKRNNKNTFHILLFQLEIAR